MVEKINSQKIKPFLRWAGGKKWLSKHLDIILPRHSYNNYHEPFLGGAAMFFILNPKKEVFLSDLNQELINVYKTLKESPVEIIHKLNKFRNNKEFYYKIRAINYSDPIDQAAKFIYLNQTSFNGIYRVNLNGEYNVPYGYRSKSFVEEENLISVSRALKNATIFHGDFEDSILNIKKADLVFLDPPYTVSHNNNGFIKYNQKLFSLEDQQRLSDLIDAIKMKGAYYILTNAAHAVIENIFEKGDTKLELKRANVIGGVNAKRGETKELIFTNIKSN